MDLSSLSKNQLLILFELNQSIDQTIERSLLERGNLTTAVEDVFSVLLSISGAKNCFVYTFDEDLKLRLFSSNRTYDAAILAEVAGLPQKIDQTPNNLEVSDAEFLIQPIEVAGEWFGWAGIDSNHEQEVFLSACLNVACEELDYYFFSIRSAREKHKTLAFLAECLKERVLLHGLQRACTELSRALNLTKTLLVYKVDGAWV